MQSNLAATYQRLRRFEEAMRLKKDVYSRYLRLHGNDHAYTLTAASNYALSLNDLKRFEETRALLRKTMPVARRVLGEGCEATLIMRLNYAKAFYTDPNATLDDLREAVTTLEEIERTARRVLGGTHPVTGRIEVALRKSQEALSARDVSSIREAVEAMTPRDAQDPPS